MYIYTVMYRKCISMLWTRKAFSSNLEPLLKPRSYVNLNQSLTLSRLNVFTIFTIDDSNIHQVIKELYLNDNTSLFWNLRVDLGFVDQSCFFFFFNILFFILIIERFQILI